MIRLSLPLPPSTNKAYRNVPGRGRAKTRAHRQWKDAAGWSIRAQTAGRPLPKVEGPYTFAIIVPFAMRGDVSNRCKLAEDLLVEMKITPDDSKAVSTHQVRSIGVRKDECLVVVRPWTISPELE